MKAKILDSHTVFFMDDKEYNQLVYNRDCLVNERDNVFATGSDEYIEYLDFMINQATANVEGYLPYKSAGDEPEISGFQELSITYEVIDSEIVQVFTVLDNDKGKVSREIERLKNILSDGDYKITKCYEANLLGKQLPYNIADLHTQRQAIRDQINELELLI